MHAFTGQIMKKFNTAACASFSLAMLLSAGLLSLSAIPDARALPAVTDPLPPGGQRCNFLPNAPDQHVVVRGDTLWGISARFLQNPWCWPQVWGMNREQIRNPHWIFPGQIVYFDRATGRLRLGTPVAAGTDGTVHLSPQIRSQPAGEAITSVRMEKIDAFLVQPLIVTEHQLQDAPVIMATPEGRVYLSKNDQAYVRGDLKGATTFQVFRPGKALRDPVTKAILGYEAAYLGIVKLQREARAKNEAHRFVVLEAREEMGMRDRLVPVPPPVTMNFVPHAPLQPVDGRIMSIYGGATLGGQNQVVAINRGSDEGVDVGAVLQLQHLGPEVRDVTDKNKLIKLPDQEIGTLFVFRVFEQISYGLIMQVNDVVNVGDIARSPE
jgi:hypothetical protein